MKFYRLTDSTVIDHIITDYPYDAPYNAYLKISYTNKESNTVKAGILLTINELVKNKLIDIKLATALAKDFPGLLNSKPLQFPESSIETPFTCHTYSHGKIQPQYKEHTSKFDKIKHGITTLRTNEKLTEEQLIAKEEAELEQALALSVKSVKDLPTLMEAAKNTCIREVNSNFCNKAIENSKKSPNAYHFFKFGEEVQLTEHYKHVVSNFTCEFQHFDLGILLLISCDDGFKQNFIITAYIKKQILNCKNLLNLAQVLETVEDGKCVAQKMKGYFEFEKDFILEEESDDLEQADDSKQNEDDYDVYGEFLDEAQLSL